MPVIDTMLLNGFRGDGEKLMDRDGDLLVVGTSATGVSGHGLNSGVARVYRRTGPTWTLEATLIPDDLSPQDKFGDAVAISGNTIVIGAPTQDAHGDNAGAAYIYHFDGTAWVFIQKLLPESFSTNQIFATAVAVEGQDLIVGAPGDSTNGNFAGAIYTYSNTGPSDNPWMLQSTIRPDDNDSIDFFGVAIAIDNGRAAVGAFENERPGPDAILPGSVYLYQRDANGWTQTDNIFPEDIHAASFGFSLDLNGPDLIIGAPSSTAVTPSGLIGEGGAAYVYHYDGDSWGSPATLSSPTLHFTDKLGQYVSIDGGVAVADAPEEYLFPTPPGPGRLHIFTRENNNTWSEQDTFVGGVTGFVAYKFFGVAPVLQGNDLVVGTDFQDLNTGEVGASLVTIDLGCMDATCPPDLNNDGTLDFFDVSAFLNAFGANDPLADFNADAHFDFFDVSAFLSSFNNGCP